MSRSTTRPLFHWLAFSETNHTHDLDVQQKSPGGVDMPQPYARKGLRGWMSTVSMRFALKEKRQGKIIKIGLTRLTSTPLSPTRSKAEACQPQPVFFAARQRHDYEAATGRRGLRRPGTHPFPLYRKKRIKILLLSLIGTFRKISEPIHDQPLFYCPALLGEGSLP